jgi:hypothetical protein
MKPEDPLPQQGTAETANRYALRLAHAAAAGNAEAAALLTSKCVGDNAHLDSWALELARDPSQMAEVRGLLSQLSNRNAATAGLQIVSAILNVNHPSIPGEWGPEIYRAVVTASSGLSDVPSFSGSGKMVSAVPPVGNILYYFASGYPDRMAQIFGLFASDLAIVFPGDNVPRGVARQIQGLLEQVGRPCRLEPALSYAIVDGLVLGISTTSIARPARYSDGYRPERRWCRARSK